MKTNALLKLHQRQVDLLDMIIKANNHVNVAKSDLNIIKATTDFKQIAWFQFVGAERDENIKIVKYTAIKERLIRYYKDIQVRIMILQPIIELTTSTEMDMVTTLS